MIRCADISNTRQGSCFLEISDILPLLFAITTYSCGIADIMMIEKRTLVSDLKYSACNPEIEPTISDGMRGLIHRTAVYGGTGRCLDG